MKATRRSVTLQRGDTRIRVESETVRHTWREHLLALFGPRQHGEREGRRRGPTEELVLNGPWWALQTRTRGGARYERLRPATRAELIAYAHLNINPQTAAWARATMIEPMSVSAAMAPPRPRQSAPELASMRELPG